jgi:hypothetical protein
MPLSQDSVPAAAVLRFAAPPKADRLLHDTSQ